MPYPTPIVISNMPELVRIAEEVEASNKPRVLKRDNTPIAVLTPVKRKQSPNAKSKAIKETLALAGAWSDLDFEEMINTLDHIRHDSKPNRHLGYEAHLFEVIHEEYQHIPTETLSGAIDEAIQVVNNTLHAKRVSQTQTTAR